MQITVIVLQINIYPLDIFLCLIVGQLLKALSARQLLLY